MKKMYLIPVMLLGLVFVNMASYAQSGVFNPNDTLVNFNPNYPPANPPNDNNVYKWGRTPTLGWNTSGWKAYYYNGMAFRVIFPPDYLTNPNKTFPLLVFFHGEGERGPVYNNELQLANCGFAINNNVLSGTFDGFAVFPQTPNIGWVSNQFTIIAGFIDSMVSEARVDPNRIIASGLSSGGDGCWRFVDQFPNLVAAATPISAATGTYVQPGFINAIKDVPFWISQGGLDQNPTPALTTSIVNTLVDSGMDIQSVAPGTEGQGRISEGYYIIYPNNGHNTWDAHYNEPLAWSYMMQAYKSDPHVYFGKRLFCPGDTINVKLELTAGFAAYQWANHGVIIPNATTNTITVTDTGTYSARILNNGVWSDWSHTPAHIMYNNLNAKSPAIMVAGLMSRVIPAPDGNTSVNLTLPSGYASYTWKNAAGHVLSTGQTYTATSTGGYVAVVSPTSGCNLQPSDTFYVASSSGPNPPSAATDLNAFARSQTSVQLNWSRNLHPVNKETGFEIYRAIQSGGPYQFAGIVPADTVQFTDNNLSPNTKYFYLVRTIDSTSAALVSKPDSVITFVDNHPPTAPGNLVVSGSTPNSVTLQWNLSTDNVAVQNYYIYINGVRTYVTPNTTFTVNNLTYKQYYTFTVKAVDLSGNISSPSNQVIAAAITRGLIYRYYTFTGNWASLPNLSTLMPVDSGQINNISLSPATQTTNFAFSFIGYINIRKAGTYTFYTNSDDGSNLYINGIKVVNNDGQHAAKSASGNYSFTTPGLYPIEVDYFQQGGGYSLSVSWQASSIGIPMSNIPDSAFIEGDSISGSAPTMPTGVTAKAVSYQQINLNWTDNSNNETGFEIYRGTTSSGPWQIIYTTKTNITSYSDSSLSPSTAYYYQVQAINQYGGSGFATQTKYDSATTWTSPPVPSAPGILSATAISISQINLQWMGTSPNVNNYNVYRSDGDSVHFRILQQVPAGTTTFADLNLFPNTIYYYKISAINAGGASGYSNTSYATTFNQAPVITAIRNQYIRYDTTTLLPLSAADSDGDALTFSASNLPAFATLKDNGNGTGSINFLPDSAQQGNYPDITLYVIDQYGARDSTMFTLLVGANYPPVITPDPPLQVNTFNSLNDTILVADRNTNAAITWQITGLPPFVDTVTMANGNLILKIQPGGADTGNYSFVVTATDNYGGSDQKTIGLTVKYVPLKKWYINFASSYGWLPYPGGPWNNVRSDTTNNLRDNQGNTSSVGIQLNTNWWATYTNGATTGNNSGVYSDTVMRDYYYFGTQGGPNTVIGAITGLDTTKTYSVTFFGSSVWQITPDNGYTDYQIGSQIDSIHVQNNTSQTITFSNVKPATNGSIAFTMSKGLNASAGYINAMVVSVDASIPPSTPTNLQLANKGIGRSNAILVNWQSGSNNTDTVDIYRSTSPAGPYSLVNPGAANGYATSYLDTSISPISATYYYYLVAANAYGLSRPSDTVSIATSQYVDRRKWYINFAASYSWLPYPGSPWNNVRSDTTNNLTDNQGNVSGVGIQLNTNWWATYTNGAKTGNNSGVYSDTVMRDYYYFGISGGPNTVNGAITGLDTTKTYSITFFGSSVWQIKPDNGYTDYQVGSRVDSIHVQNNTSQTVIFSNIKPASNGSIPFTMSLGAGASAGFVNAIVVSTETQALPTTPLNLQLANTAIQGSNAVQVNWQLGSTNANTIAVYRSTTKNGNYTLLDPDSLNGYNTIYTDRGVIAGNTYYYYLVAVNSYGSSASSDTLSITVPQYVDNRQWYINFAASYGWLSYPGSPWNNVRSDTADNLIDNQGNGSMVGIQLNTNWWATYTNGAQTGNNSGIYSDTVMRDFYYFGRSGGPDTVGGVITGLDTAKTYNVTFFGSSVWQITSDNGYTDYRVGSQVDSIHVQNNTSQTVTFSKIKPAANGTISFTMSKGLNASAGYLNAMVVTTYANYPPASPVNFQLKNKLVNNKPAVEVDWQLGSNNTDTVKIYRTTSQTGVYTLLNQSIGGSSTASFTDTTVAVGGNYYYYLVSSNPYGSSSPTDTLFAAVTNLVPATPLNLQLSNVVADSGRINAVMVSWQLGASNADTIAVYRATSKAGTYTLMNPGIANGDSTSYMDTTVALGTTYYYCLQAKNSYGISAPTDTAIITTNAAPLPPPVISGLSNAYVSGGLADTLKVSASASGSSINFILQNAPSFVTLQQTGTNSANLVIAPQTSNYGAYDSIGVIANASNGTSATSYFNVYVSSGGVSQVINLNFTNGGYDCCSTSWNNLNYSGAANNQFNNLINSFGQPTSVSVSTVNTWAGAADFGADTYNNSGFVPDSVMASFCYVSDTATRTIQIAGLDTTMRYNFIFFASSNYGGNTNYTTNYTINGQTVTLNGIQNTSKTVRINGIQPDSAGIVTVSVAMGSTAANGLLNAVIIEGYKNGIMVAPANLTAVTGSNNSVNLTWSDRSYNEQQFQVWRSHSQNGTYTNIANLPAGSTSYVDNAVATDTRYFYKVIAANVSVSSLSSNIASVTTPQSAIYVNFNYQETPAPAPWNNTQTFPQAGNVYGPFLDNNGDNTGITLNMINNFEGEATAGQSTGNNSGVYPDLVLGSCYYSDNGMDTINMQLTNLDLTKLYDLSFFGSVSGVGWVNTTQFVVNNQIVSLETSYNTSNTVTLSRLSPDQNGLITVKIICTPQSRYAILNAMVIKQYDNYDSNGNKVINPNLLMYNRVKNGLELNNKLGIKIADSAFDNLQLIGNVYPNPFEQLVNLIVASPQSGILIMTMVNVNGQVVDRKTQAVSAGYNRIHYITKAGLAPGMYILSLRMESSDQVVNVKLVKGLSR